MRLEIISTFGLDAAEHAAAISLRDHLPSHWVGYAGFLMTDTKGKTMEIDMLIFADDRVFLVELKNLAGTIEMDDRTWYQTTPRGDKINHPSPLHTKRQHAMRIQTLFKRDLESSWGAFFTVQPMIVLCGNAKVTREAPTDAPLVVHLDDFKDIGDSNVFKRLIPEEKSTGYFYHNQNLRPSNSGQIRIFDEWRKGGKAIQNRYRTEASYTIPEQETPMFSGPLNIRGKSIYTEHIGEHTRDVDDKAIVRIWDFNSLQDVDTTCKIREFLGLREDRALRYMTKADHQLSKDYLLQAKHNLNEDALTADMAEVYALPSLAVRLDDFLSSGNLSTEERLSLLRSVLTPLASMHAIGVSHRDLSTRRLWWDSTSGAVLVSGLTNAKFPDSGFSSLADLRQTMQTCGYLSPEDAMGESDVSGQSLDVFNLGVMAYEIAFGEPLPLPGKEDAPEWVEPSYDTDLFEGKLNTWFQKALEVDANERFTNAGEMLEGLAKAINLTNIDTNKDKDRVQEELKAYATMAHPMMTHPANPQSSMVQDPIRNRMVWQSVSPEGRKLSVRIFGGAAQTVDNHGKAQRVLSFFERCKTASSNVVPIPHLVTYGNNMGAFIVQEYAEGQTLEQYMEEGAKSYEERYAIADALLRAIHKVHDLELPHGDLKPENILIQQNDNDLNVLLLDMFDMDAECMAPCNSEYSPKNDVSAFARDRYATYLIVDEVFGGCRSSGAKMIRSEIRNALGEDLQTVPRDLELLRRTMTMANEPEVESAEPIIVANGFFTEESLGLLESDGGVYHLTASLKANRLKVFILGFTHKLTINATVDGDEITLGRMYYDPLSGLDLTTDSRLLKKKNQGTQPIEQPLILEKMQGTDSKINMPFIEFLKGLSVIQNLLHRDAIEDLLPTPIEGDVPVEQIWRRLVEVERETLPTVTITRNSEEKNGQVHVQIAEDIGAFDFAHDDVINVTTDNHDTRLGQLDVKESGNGLLVLEAKGQNHFRLKNMVEGVKLTLSNSGSDTSWDRRNDALHRILSGEAVMSDLIQRFKIGPQGEQPPVLPQPTSEQLEAYGLDDSKKEAFAYALNNALSVLMGPPGTGKTKLSSAILHHLMTNADVRRILVVSQSHIAADEVAVRARELMMSVGNSGSSALLPSIVRLGDRDRISPEMVDVHTSALQAQTRTKFHAELEARMLFLASRLKLPKGFVLAAAGLYRTCGIELYKLETARKVLRDKRMAAEDYKTKENEINLNRAERLVEQLEASLRGRLRAYTDNPAPIVDHNSPMMAALEIIAEAHQVYNPLRLKRIADVIGVTHHWFQRLTVDEGYAAFAARTRQLVVGTLVGIGSGQYQIQKNSFDLVIIDEAGRATFSELAIAMQSAKRVMLVGDHKQLEPSYDTDQIKEVCQSLGMSREEVTRTDFERAFNLNDGHMLNTQYRMAPAIGEIISDCFYDGKLKTGREAAPEWMSELPTPWNKTVSWIDTSGDQYLETNTKKGGVSNEAEVDLLCSLLQQFVAAPGTMDKLKEWDKSDSNPPIGIITGYRKQVELLEHRLDSATWATGLRDKIKIDTIDSYQGSENRIIMLSLVRHNANQKTGFMNDNARVNVALSRAKERLMIVGAGSMWIHTSNDSPLSRVYKYMATQNSPDHHIVKPNDIRDTHEANTEERAHA
ncbi:AAA domain-containing protein [Vibrio brasiliensis]|uniref:AAA domain-containing protein n=1 Tax=Vibrio brasiliensis TaxID=170652 RepID=UPI001EFE2232|nr:AAA domain-containing protein [Vibrio brasiliensis]MCG9647969.1 AAA domain-containing protein [Vibrio brasiliensis]